LNRMKRLAALAAAMLLAVSAGAGLAEVSEEKTMVSGKVASVTWKDENGVPAAGPEGYAEVRYIYGRGYTKETYFDAEGKPFETAGGYCGKAVTRDGKDKITKIEYFGADGQLTLNSMGYAAVEYAYYSFGEERKVVFYGDNGKPVIVPSLGYAQVQTDYSGTTLTGRTYMDVKGNAVDIPAGYAIMKVKMKDHKVIRIWYTHADGKPATGPDGWYKCEMVRDTKGRVTTLRYLDIQENLTDAAGFAREEYTYEKNGYVKVARYNTQGSVIPWSGKAVSVRRKMKDEKVLEETFLDETGQPTEVPEGYITVSYTYNSAGQLETIQYRDANGNKQNCRSGYSTIRQTWNRDGLLQRRTFLDVNGLNVNNLKGVCEEEYIYDEEGRLTGTRQYDAAGNQLK